MSLSTNKEWKTWNPSQCKVLKNKTRIIDRYIDRKQNKLHRFGAKLYLVNRNYRESNKL